MITYPLYKQTLRPSVLMAGIVLASIPVFSFNPNANSSWIPQALSVGLFFLLLIEVLGSEKNLGMPAALILLVAWVTISAASIILSSTVRYENTAFWSVVKVVGMTLLFSYVLDAQKDLQLILWCILVSFPVVVVLNLDTLSSYGGLQALSSEQERLAGTLGNANTMALYALIVIWASVTLLFTSTNRFKWMAVAITVVVLWIVILSGSRKGMIGIPLFLVTGYWFHARHTVERSLLRKALRVIFFLALTWGTIELLFMTAQSDRLTVLLEGREESSSSARLDMASAGLKLFSDHPLLGAGFDSFRSEAWRYGTTKGSYSHSTVIEVLSCTGIVGFLLYFGALAALFVLFFRASTICHTSVLRKTFQWSLCLWVLFLWFNLFAVEYDSKFTWPVLGALAGYAYRYRKTPWVPAANFSFQPDPGSVMEHEVS